MAVLTAMRKVPGAIARNPVLLVLFGAIGLLEAPEVLARTISPLVALLVSLVFWVVYLFVYPFVHAGAIAVADDALAGKTGLATFLAAGKRNYVSMFGAYLILVALMVALGIVALVGTIAAGISIGIASGGDGGGLLAIAGLLLFVGLLVLVVVFFTQFYGQEIVLNDASAIDGLNQSVSLVRTNFASTIGYSVIVSALGGVLGLGFGLASITLQSPVRTDAMISGAMPQLPLMNALGMIAIVVAFTMLFGTLFGLYSVSFYRELRPRLESTAATDS